MQIRRQYGRPGLYQNTKRGHRSTCLFRDGCWGTCDNCYDYERGHGFCVECGDSITYMQKGYKIDGEIWCRTCVEEWLEKQRLRVEES